MCIRDRRHSVKFRQLWPNVDLIENEIFVQDDNIYTSAGVSCGIDLCLHLVENDLGYDIAKSIAKELVLYLRRNGGQKQYSELLNLCLLYTSRCVSETGPK